MDPARQVAFDTLRRVADEDAYLNLALAKLRDERGISGRDAAFATELAAGTARMQGGYDAVLDVCVRGGIATLQPEVAVALRMGAHQLLSMRVPAHAAVGTTVELVRASVGERPVRLTNAVLRAVGGRSLDEWLDVCAPPRDSDLLGHLAVRFSHPRWVVEEFARLVGTGTELEALLAADNDAPTVTLALRPGLVDLAALPADAVSAGRWSPYAAVVSGGDPGAVAAVRDGRAGVQDEGSQLAALMLPAAVMSGPDARWLDLCAGPGGKSALLSGIARQRGATLLSAERLEHRARLVRSSLRGFGSAGTVICVDGTRPAWPGAAFDRVLVDVPCSGLGALRRRPEARWRRTRADVETLVPLQRSLLGAALDAVRPGGVVLYVTCSPVVAETRGVVDAVCEERNDVQEMDARSLLPDVPDLGDGPHVQLWPHVHGTDAIFVSLLVRG